MARHFWFLIGAVLAVAGVTACQGGPPVNDDTKQSYTVVNSASSTFRIVSGQAGPVGGLLKYIYFDGDGLHKGHSQSFGVGDNECGKDWKVFVYYNDPGSTSCSLVKRVPCGGSATFVFNNTNCSH